jgi:hypothetical protein
MNKTALLSALFAATALLAACGGDEASAPATPAPPVAATPAATPVPAPTPAPTPVPTPTPPAVAFTDLRDVSNTSVIQSAANYGFKTITNGDAAASPAVPAYGSVAGTAAVPTFNGAVGDRNIQAFLGGSAVDLGTATTIRVVGLTTTAKRVAIALVKKTPVTAACQVMYEFPVVAGTTQYDLPLASPTTNSYGQTLCTAAADIAAVKADVGDVVLRAFGNGDQGTFAITTDINLTIDKIQKN